MSPSTRRPGGDRVTRQLEALACLADLRDDAGSEHSYRVGRLAFLLAIDLGQDHETAASLEFAARLHDVGNLAVPDVLLLKHGKLVGKELDIMRRHTTEGCKMLTDILGTVEREKRAAMHTRVESLRVAAEIALHHHEWWDGSGYPRCIRGGAIPEPARIVALVDAFDVLVHARPYKTACSIDDALAEISSLSGRQFEPRICNAFVTLLRKLQRGGTDVLARIEPLDCRLSPYAAANRAIERIVESARAPASPKAASRMEKWPAGV